MIKKIIEFLDLDGNKVQEEVLFHLSKADLIQMGTSEDGGIKKYLEDIVASGKPAKIMEGLRFILQTTYGKRSADGKQFVKSPDLFAEFAQTEAYSELLYELVTNAEAASNFINGLLPQELLAKATASAAQMTLELPAGDVQVEQKTKRPEDYTEAEILEMPLEQFQALMASYRGGNIPRGILQIALRRAE
jgi:hypothetical protein